uniref:Uncharacterized protein n=1 Tax=uncultured microorganism TaxID=358574 RepID=I2FJL8_9ZZZZ|nr:hypothetical protein [uncultured microorganism]
MIKTKNTILLTIIRNWCNVQKLARINEKETKCSFCYFQKYG